MRIVKPNRHILIGASIVVVAAIGITVTLALRHENSFNGTTLARIQQPTHKPACLQKTGTNQTPVDKQDTTYIGNAVASSIMDVPAGTNVDVYFKTYTDTKATGSAVYSGSYGTYNFEVINVDKNAGGYMAGWRITHFEACRG